jgi:hypothetical protein
MKEINANQVLALLFISLGSDASVSFADIDRFFDVLIDVRNRNVKNSKQTIGINMPMNGNFDEKLFKEIKEGKNAGNLELVKHLSLKNEEIIKEKLTKHFILLVGSNKDFMNDCKVAMKIFNEEYYKNKVYDENIEQITNVTFLERLKGLVKHK